MDKEQLKKLSQNPKFIPGIYNYCDRWCERCPFTSRCMNYAIGQEDYGDLEGLDINNKEFWLKLSETLSGALDLLREMLEERGINIDEVNAEEAIKQEELTVELAEDHECARDAKVYYEMVEKWMVSSKDIFEKKAEELSLNLQLDIPESAVQQKAESIMDSVEIIGWYQHFIYVKIMRALTGELVGLEDILEDIPKDSDGSAKVALIAIDRSLAAWLELYNNFPDKEDEILEFLIHLDRLRKKVEKTFPAARAFVRPGFEEFDLNKSNFK